MRCLCVSMRLVERRTVVRLLDLRFMFPGTSLGAVVLVNGESGYDDGQGREIDEAAMVMHQEGSKKEVMDEKEQEVNGETAPHDEDLVPVE